MRRGGNNDQALSRLILHSYHSLANSDTGRGHQSPARTPRLRDNACGTKIGLPVLTEGATPYSVPYSRDANKSASHTKRPPHHLSCVWNSARIDITSNGPTRGRMSAGRCDGDCRDGQCKSRGSTIRDCGIRLAAYVGRTLRREPRRSCGRTCVPTYSSAWPDRKHYRRRRTRPIDQPIEPQSS